MRKFRNRYREEKGKKKTDEMMEELSELGKIKDTGEYDTSGTQDSHLERSGVSTI